jgi:hypothetical protein
VTQEIDMEVVAQAGLTEQLEAWQSKLEKLEERASVRAKGG